MSLNALARRISLVALRSSPLDPPEEDEWGRKKRGPLEVVASWRGDIQPRRVRGGTGEVVQADNAGTVLEDLIVFADVLDIRQGDVIRREVDDGHRYQVNRIDHIGEGVRLEHLEVGVDHVYPGVPIPGDDPGPGS